MCCASANFRLIGSHNRSSSFPLKLGNAVGEQHPALCAPRSMTPVSRSQRIRIAVSAWPRGSIAPMSRISSATPAPAAARSACRQGISASGWYASTSPGSRAFRPPRARHRRWQRPDIITSCGSGRRPGRYETPAGTATPAYGSVFLRISSQAQLRCQRL
jgi:hypothetical protein